MKRNLLPFNQPQPIIELKAVTKCFTLRQEKPTFSEQLLYGLKTKKFVALKNISLSIKKGEHVGIIGPNGAGKTTLLKVIAQITTPEVGQVRVSGKVVSLLEVGAGFHPDLTGRENIFLNGLLIGMRRQEIQHQLKNIITFADIGSFMDVPLYTYSQGMKLRLGFSVAVHSQPDVIILDETVSAGDADFNVKIDAKITQLMESGTTVLIVSHWLDYLQQRCQRFICIRNATIVGDGGLEIIRAYDQGKL